VRITVERCDEVLVAVPQIFDGVKSVAPWSAQKKQNIKGYGSHWKNAYTVLMINCLQTLPCFLFQAQILLILYEHASGYALFRVKEFEEVSMLQSQVEKCVTDLSKFQSIIKLSAFSPFKSGTNALDNINSISEGIVLRARLTWIPTPTLNVS
jgi:hypothetical protein